MGYAEIAARVAAAAEKAGRAAQDVKLIAVSKVQPNARVEAVLEAGHRVFGENKLQEAERKWPAFQERFGAVELHLLGPLQTNKAKKAVALFDVIHSLDRVKLAAKIADEIQAQGRAPQLFVQVNTGEEPQKAGILPHDLPAFLAKIAPMDLPVVGLMCIPPVNEEPSLHFALLRKLAARHGLAGLSMGMSDDFERAIALGATHVRVGSAIFGARDYG